jgi:thiamine biosynthesis lipoprotein ApbE
MDTTTQYKLNKYSKKVNDAYQQNNMTKVSEYMQHQFNYINKYVKQTQKGGNLHEIQAALNSIVDNVKALVEQIQQNRKKISELDALERQLEEARAQAQGV